MPIKFNTLLRAADIDPQRVRLIRHQDRRTGRDRTPYILWRDHPADFMAYQSEQSRRSAALLGKAEFWAVFVVTPAKETLFVGLYTVGESSPIKRNITSATIDSAIIDDGDIFFELSKSVQLAEFEEKLVIDWGSAFIVWIQKADNQDKDILELRTEFKEPIYPGHLHIAKQLSEIETLPGGWKTALSAVQGVYVLTCPKTHLLYVGSATGQGGFYERWLQHARSGGDALELQKRDRSDYQVSILEVAASGTLPEEIVRLEHLWMRKLQTIEMGLNSGSKRRMV